MASIRRRRRQRRRRQLDRTPRASVRRLPPPAAAAAAASSPTRMTLRRRSRRTCSVRSYAAFKCMACNERANERPRTAEFRRSLSAGLRNGTCRILDLTNKTEISQAEFAQLSSLSFASL